MKTKSFCGFVFFDTLFSSTCPLFFVISIFKQLPSLNPSDPLSYFSQAALPHQSLSFLAYLFSSVLALAVSPVSSTIFILSRMNISSLPCLFTFLRAAVFKADFSWYGFFSTIYMNIDLIGGVTSGPASKNYTIPSGLVHFGGIVHIRQDFKGSVRAFKIYNYQKKLHQLIRKLNGWWKNRSPRKYMGLLPYFAFIRHTASNSWQTGIECFTEIKAQQPFRRGEIK